MFRHFGRLDELADRAGAQVAGTRARRLVRRVKCCIRSQEAAYRLPDRCRHKRRRRHWASVVERRSGRGDASKVAGRPSRLRASSRRSGRVLRLPVSQRHPTGATPPNIRPACYACGASLAKVQRHLNHLQIVLGVERVLLRILAGRDHVLASPQPRTDLPEPAATAARLRRKEIAK